MASTCAWSGPKRSAPRAALVAHGVSIMRDHDIRPVEYLRCSLAVWDNRQTVHYGAKGYGTQPRLLRRITLRHDGAF